MALTLSFYTKDEHAALLKKASKQYNEFKKTLNELNELKLELKTVEGDYCIDSENQNNKKTQT